MKRGVKKIFIMILVAVLMFAVPVRSFAHGILPQQGNGNEASQNTGDNQSESQETQPSDPNQENPSGNTSEAEAIEEQNRRADLYTIIAIIALAAILVGIREKKRGR